MLKGGELYDPTSGCGGFIITNQTTPDAKGLLKCGRFQLFGDNKDYLIVG